MVRAVPACSAILGLLLLAGATLAAEPTSPSPKSLRAAISKSLPLLWKGAEGHVTHRTCFACHNQGIPVLALTTARDHGFPLRPADLKKQLDFIAAFLEGNRESYREGKGQGGQVDTAGYALWTLEAGGWKPDATTEAVVEYLLKRDADRDHWRTTSNRPPSEVSDFTPTYLALRALRVWGTAAQRERIARRVDAVRDWLLKAKAKDTEDRVFRLWALKEAGADRKTVAEAAQELLQTQHAAGGWAQTADLAPDAYATGSALVALHEAGGLSTEAPAYRRGLGFLLRTQLADGSWHVVSRSKPFQTYFESGFPRGKDQFISMAASAWATTALALAYSPEPLVVAKAADTPKPGTADGVAFFEKKVRPVLVEHCYKCHSTEARANGKLKGGLLLDSQAGLRRGGESGPAVVPGKPEEGTLLRAVRYTDEVLRMPPKGRLPDAVVAELEAWVRMGAPVPAEAVSRQAANRASHWAFQPIRDPCPPAVKNQAWLRTPVDAFILARLEAKGLSPSAPADRRTLLRRVTIDLTGLPPSPEETDDFLADRAPDAYERLVDRLLASPAYGERWARHWLDVARYADTKDGVLMFGDDRVRPYAYTYRDYVIRAFNEDLPFDRFVHEQLAADLLSPKVEPWRLAAMGYLTLGKLFDNNIFDILDDRIDTVSRGLLGLTVGCARCHDHKYDPIPMADYYSLYGVFASSEQPLIPPSIGPAKTTLGAAAFEKQFAAKRADVETMLDKQFALLSETARQRIGDYLVHVATTKPDPLESAIYFLSLAPEDLRPPIVARWRNYLEVHARPGDPVFGLWHELFTLPDAAFALRAREVLNAAGSRPVGTQPGQVNPLVREALAGAPLTSKADIARAYGVLLRRVYDESKQSPPADAVRRQLLDVVAGPESPAYFPKSQTWRFMSRADKDAFGGKLVELDRLAVRAPDAPPRAMTLVDAAEPYEPHVFLRGNPSRLGERVPRQSLEVLSGPERKPFPHGSGRLDLARAITADHNPLTSRVIVNRIWMHHFSEPLVDTPNDFGTRSNPPTHPELLDYLATHFRRDDRSLKKLHRLLVLSSTYQQSSCDRPDCRKIDPDNRLLWRMNRQRLDLEAMRDTLLAVSGRLDRRLYGRPVDAAGDPHNTRRTVYGLVDRQSLPGLYRAFDFASPDQSAERRPQTTVPQQALFGMNSPFVLEQARALAGRPEVAREPDRARRVAALYLIVLGRAPSADESRLAREFIDGQGNGMGAAGSRLDPWQQLAQVLLLSNELMFAD